MYPRVNYEMTEEDLKALLDACKPGTYIVVGGMAPASPQENANRAWAILGQKMGFDGATVLPIRGKGNRFFSAVPSETPEQEKERLEKEAQKRRQSEIERLHAEKEKILFRLDELGEKGIHYFMDGNQWCAVYPDFTNLQESPAGFGDTREEARQNLSKEK